MERFEKGNNDNEETILHERHHPVTGLADMVSSMLMLQLSLSTRHTGQTLST